METKVIYSTITNEILEKTKSLKEYIKSNFIPGDTKIVEGIEMFEITLKELNPEYIDDDIQSIIENSINSALTNTEEMRQRGNHHIHLGINYCYSILEGYNKNAKRRLKSIEI